MFREQGEEDWYTSTRSVDAPPLAPALAPTSHTWDSRQEVEGDKRDSSTSWSTSHRLGSRPSSSSFAPTALLLSLLPPSPTIDILFTCKGH